MATRRLLTSATRPCRPASSPAQQKRYISAYGYEQAKALVFSQHGEPADVLQLHSHSISPAHGDQLTVRFLASPMNPADINQLQGVYPSKPVFTTALGTSSPIAVGGNEGVAEVLSLGSGVKGLSKGDWVIMKAPSFGTWRTHAQTTADKLLKITDKSGLTPLQAGTVSVNPCTAYRMLRDFANLQPGDWFIQNGANSGVGRAAIQLARIWGFNSINVIRDRESKPELDALKQELTDLGATAVVTDTELQSRDFGDRVKELTDGGRARLPLALNCVGGKMVNSMAKLLSPDGHLVTYGGMSKQPTMLPTGILIFKNIHFDGFWISKWGEKHPDEKQVMLDDVLDLIRRGEFRDMPMDEVEWTWQTKQEPLG